jgi:hypothetical protein
VTWSGDASSLGDPSGTVVTVLSRIPGAAGGGVGSAVDQPWLGHISGPGQHP